MNTREWELTSGNGNTDCVQAHLYFLHSADENVTEKHSVILMIG